LVVYDAIGKLMSVQYIDNESIIVDMSSYASGLYYFRFVIEGRETKTIKVIKQ
ncbi:MAG: T9SS type A sorting domain-containing protein, partial [Bacteroidales bacterium]|nr:T9SS type A sorting domain-containing protein [Bacteroidales bacterium]